MVVNGVESEWKEVISCLRQGSVLGPVLFVLYRNSLPKSVLNSKIIVYIDDTELFRNIKEREDCIKNFREDLERMKTSE